MAVALALCMFEKAEDDSSGNPFSADAQLGCLLQLFIVDDDTALAYPKHYHGLYLAIEAVKRVQSPVMLYD